MQFNWQYPHESPMTIKQFLVKQNIPRSFVSWVKFSGEILLNNQAVTVRSKLKQDDHLMLIAPDETGHDTVVPSHLPIEIVYEDRDFLIVNKPMGVVSIPSVKNPDASMANRVKGYYLRQVYDDQVIHIVTRLDRDTTGLMLIAKHRLAHAMIDRQIQDRTIVKLYDAISAKADWPLHGKIEAPIARDENSIITRRVHASGKNALTEYWRGVVLSDSSLLRLQLHTGRTHQIRVHLSYMGGPLVGDDLYGGPLEVPLTRQALHCGELHFIQPFTQERLQIKQGLPADMLQWIESRTF